MVSRASTPFDPGQANLAHLLERNLAERPGEEALVDLADGRRWTHAELHDEVAAVAAGLEHRGIIAGDVVALLGTNSAQMVIALLALGAVGAVSAPLNARLHPEELGYVLGQADPELLLADPGLLERLGAAGLPSDRNKSLDLRGGGPDSLEALVAEHRGAPLRVTPVGMEHPQRVLYTSGTTSRPKGVTITHGNVRWNVVTQRRELELSARDRLLICLPLFHVAGIDGPGLCALDAGGALVISPGIDAATVCSAIDAERVTGSILAPPTAAALAEAVEDGRVVGRGLRFLVFGGLPEDVFMRVHRALPHTRLVEAMGMTECTSGILYVEAERMVEKRASVGRPVAEVEIRVVDGAGRDVNPGELGELIVRGPKVSPGYWRDESETREAWRDGWLHSGDIVRVDEDGYVFVVDRKKDMIRSGGENVASAEVERVLLAHAAVAEVAVVGAPDPRWGEVPHAFVVTRGPATEEGLMEHCRASLARFKVPARIELVAELPRTGSGKVRKPELRRQVAEAMRA